MVRPLEVNSYLFGGILSKCFSEESQKSDFSDKNLFQEFGQHLNEVVIQPTVSYEAPSVFKMSAPNDYE